MPSAQELEIQATFANACDALSEDQLFVLMDDYKALATIAAIHSDRKALLWLEHRVHVITEAYSLYSIGGRLPF